MMQQHSTFTVDMQSEIPNIPGYEIYPRKPLGVGGFAKVFLARHKSFQIDVALKIMDSELAKDSEFCKRFLREGRICAKLGTHPNIMNIYDIGCVDDAYYFSMQLLTGPTLHDLLNDRDVESGIKSRDPLLLLLPIVEALGYAHRNGFVHRDIKPANILFNEDGEAMLSDFGIAKSFDQHTLSAEGAAIGTPAYMSPEQATASDQMDGRSDLYSLGVVLFELLSGEQPFKSDTAIGTMLQHVNAPVPRLPDHQKKHQPLIDRLMAKDPAARYPDSEALLVDMKRFISGSEDDDKTRRIDVLATTKTRQWRTPILSIVSVFCVVLVGLWVLNRAESPPPPPIQDDPKTAPDASGNDSVGTPQTNTQIDKLLQRAALFEDVGDLVAPPGSNALEIYEEVLKIEPNHVKALSRKSELTNLLE